MIDFILNIFFNNDSHVMYMFFFFNSMRFNNLNFNDTTDDEYLNFVNNDNFKDTTLLIPENKPNLIKLENLKKEVNLFYQQSCSSILEITDKEGNNITSDFHIKNINNAFNNYKVQIARLRMVIEPEFNITRVVQPLNQICYLSARGYWYNDSGLKRRTLTRNFGKEKDYPNGKDDPKAYEDARREIQILTQKLYKSLYP